MFNPKKANYAFPYAYQIQEMMYSHDPEVQTKGKMIWKRYLEMRDCTRCQTDTYVPHFNCIRSGAIGHSKTHCTASACF